MRTNGLARAALRFKPAAFAGTFLALFMAAMIVSACGILLETGLRASVPPGRYADAPVVVAADQQAHHPVVDAAGDRSDHGGPVPDRARLDAALVARAAAVPGVHAAIGDTTFPVRTDRAALTGHGWGATALTGERATTGRAPAPGEVALTVPGPVRTPAGEPPAVGDRITLHTAEGARTFRVAALVPAAGATPTAWFHDTEAPRIAGHPGRIDAIAVLPEAGVPTTELKGRVAAALGDAAEIHTGEDRGAVAEPGLGEAKELLIGLGGSFGGTATLVAVFTAAGTVALSVGQRAREYALLRAIGTTPRQVRRAIATETLLIAPLAGALGCLPGTALATWWFGQLQDKGALPRALDLAVSPLPLLAAVAAVVLTGLVAGWAAARRPARIRPGQALARAAVERSLPGPLRLGLGIAAAVGGTALAAVAQSTAGEDAANAAMGVVLLFMLAVALLGPLVARACAALVGLPMRGAGAAGALAAANSRTNARRLASAITPIVLAVAFASTLLFLHSSQDRATVRQQGAGVIADHVVRPASGGLAPDAVAAAADRPGVRAAVGLLRTAVLVPTGSGDTAMLRTASAQGVDGPARDLAAVQELDVRRGALDLGPGRAAVDLRLAEAADVTVGDRLPLRLPDGTERSVEVVATYAHGLGLSEVTMVRGDLARHVTDPFAAELWVKGGSAADLAAHGTVIARGDYTSAASVDRELNAWANRLMAAVLGGFAAVASANTLVMTVLDRRRELGTLRLIGSTRRQVLRMVRWEALLVAAVGVVLGSAIALATLVPMVRGITGEGVHIPPAVYGSLVGGALLLGLLATALPARFVLRAPHRA
ncbi:FtsX-like permease family protein [Streptomyces sp. NPDC049906]|uniref:ABC transporter permease n=1 Tax=Streptomyces sp. NPDC049906 TaxID=3155656 RepID=UPI003420A845